MKQIIYLIALLFSSLTLQAQEQSFTIPFSSQDQEKSIEIQFAKGNITVEGTDRTDVLVRYEVSGQKNDQHKKQSKNGMKKISSGSISLEAKEKNNHVSIYSQFWGSNLTIYVEVPRKIEVQVQKNIGNGIIVKNIHGDVSAETNTGNVEVTGVKGNVNASSNTGRIKVVINELEEMKAMQFFSTTGDIDLTLPANAKFNFKMRTDWGDIYSDLDLVMNSNPAQMEKSKSDDGTFRVVSNVYKKATINGGGPEITMNTKMGSIYIRKN